MIIYEKEERPFVETPDPRLGVILSRLNEMSLAIESDINTDHNLAKEELSKITGLLGAYSTELRNLVATHVNKRGAVHNEDKGDVGLPDVDNYRKASKNEVLEGSDVDAWVTVGDAKEKVEQSLKELNEGEFQKNVRVNFSSYFTPNKFPIKKTVGVGNDRFIGLVNNKHGQEEVGLLVSNDRLVYSTLTTPNYGSSPSPTQPGNRTFITSPITQAGRFSISERYDIDVDEIVTYGLNSEVGRTQSTVASKASELVVLRRTSKIVEISKFPDLSKTKNDSVGFTEVRDKTVSILVGVMTNIHIPSGNNVFETRHCLVRTKTAVNNLEIIPGVNVNWNGLSGKLTQGHNLYRARNINDYITPSPGQVVKIDTTLFNPKITYHWLNPNKKVLVNILIPILVTDGSKKGEFKLSITEEISVPLEGVSENISVTEIGSWKKTVLLSGPKTNLTNGDYLSPRDPQNALDLSYGSGVLTKTGVLIKAVKTAQGFYLKRFGLGEVNVRDLIDEQVNHNKHPTYKGTLYSHSVTTPGLSKPSLPVDLIDAGSKGFLVKGNDLKTGTSKWFINETNNGKMNDIGVSKFPITNPPKELISYTYKEQTSGKMEKGISGMIFQESNGFEGYSDISFTNQTFVRRGLVKLSNKTLTWFRGQQMVLANSVKDRLPVNIKPTGFLAELPVYDSKTGTLKKVLLVVNSLYKQGVEPQALVSTSYRITNNILEYTGKDQLTTQPVKTGQPTLSTSTGKHNLPDTYSVKSDSGDDLDSNGLKVKTEILSNSDVRFEFYGVGGSFSSILRVDINPTTLKITNLKTMSEPDYFYRNSNINVRSIYDLNAGSGFDLSLGANNAVGVKGQDFVLTAGTEFIMEGTPYRLDEPLSIPFTTVNTNKNKDGISFIYLVQVGGVFSLKAYKEMREPYHYELLVARYGLDKGNQYTHETDYILLDEFLISPIRRGTAAAAFDQDNVNRFFKTKDIVDL